ncbi:MAG: sugar isomerase [Fibrobacterota bacterium]|jgi:D-sedoheptulose 7-phosphate isomerase
METLDKVVGAIDGHLRVAQALLPMAGEIAVLGELMAQRLKAGSKILWMGNGGSAADSQHLAAEIVGRFVKERRGLPSIALTTDTSILTAVGNDYGFEQIFSRQVEALALAGDVVVGISTSGNSPNVVRAIEAAKLLGAHTVGFTGEGGGKLAGLCDTMIRIPATVTARIQECHILVGHILCECIDAHY